MGLSHRVFGAIGLAAMCCCLLTGRGLASEVIGILSDLDGDFRGIAHQLSGGQARLGRLEAQMPRLGDELSPTRAVAELDALGAGASRTLAELRSRLTKVREILPALREKFPEDLNQVESYFEGWQSLQLRAEGEYAEFRGRLDVVRERVAQMLAGAVNPAARATLLDAVRARLLVRDAALSAARRPPPQEEAEPVETPAPPQAGRAPARTPARTPALLPALGHPPRRPVESARAEPPAATAASPVHLSPAAVPAGATGPEHGSVTMDLEQLIQEMEKQ